ncbi:MAG: FKBP-type peptidyl-prolyl cis-trans isomerase [Lachnospiraceae bacterium]|nr:FKBP-type peptidyl-prolyl cis-trans isomerase [Lachnospiraceae bacterium]
MKKYQGKKFLTKACAMATAVGLLMTGCSPKRGGDETTAAPTQAGTVADPSGDSTEPSTESYLLDPNQYVIDLDSINVSDFLDLSKVKNLKIKTSDVTAGEAFIKYQISQDLINNYGFELATKEGAVEGGDTVTIDYKGYINGVRFDGGTAADAELGIGSGRFIPGFEEGIIGRSAGESFDLSVTFPEDYQDTDFAGKAAIFKVTLKKIQTLPEVTDDQLKEKTKEKYTSYKTYAEEKTEEIKKNYHDSIILGKIMSAVTEKKEHEGLIDEYVKEQLANVDRACAAYGIDRLTYLNSTGYTADQFEALLKDNGKAYAKQKLTILGICRDEGMVIKDGEMEAFKQKLLEDYKEQVKSEEELLKIMTEDELEYQLLYEKFLEYLKDYKTVD